MKNKRLITITLTALFTVVMACLIFGSNMPFAFSANSAVEDLEQNVIYFKHIRPVQEKLYCSKMDINGCDIRRVREYKEAFYEEFVNKYMDEANVLIDKISNYSYVSEEDKTSAIDLKNELIDLTDNDAKLEVVVTKLNELQETYDELSALEADLEYQASLPKTVNFDNYFSTIHVTNNDYSVRQRYVDQGYIAQDYEDYFHHNTSDFTSIFYSINPGDSVIIDGKEYIASWLEYGYLGSYVVNEDGLNVRYTSILGNSSGDIWGDGRVDIITCTNNSGGRAIWHLS